LKQLGKALCNSWDNRFGLPDSIPARPFAIRNPVPNPRRNC
jgi:hypothetical protein